MAGVGYRLQGASNEKENTMNKVKRKERERGKDNTGFMVANCRIESFIGKSSS
jgi:hypothetical protein